jgi:hypothetical protein
MKKLLRRWLGIEQLETGFRAFTAQTSGDIERLQTDINDIENNLVNVITDLETLIIIHEKPKKKPAAKKSTKR